MSLFLKVNGMNNSFSLYEGLLEEGGIGRRCDQHFMILGGMGIAKETVLTITNSSVRFATMRL